MLKKIDKKSLVPGMYIHEFCGSWLEHPFWRNGFVLETQEDLRAILKSAIAQLWIDSSKGLDINAAETLSTSDNDRSTLSELSEAKFILDRQEDGVQVGQNSFEQEVKRAKRIIETSQVAVRHLFKEIRMGKVADERLARKVVEEISSSALKNTSALMRIARLKQTDNYTYMHSVAVCGFMVALSNQLGMTKEEQQMAGYAGLMHDIGKICIPLEILNKPGKLTQEEFLIVKNHPVEGHELLTGAKINDEIALDVCLHHHERTDGTGYPKALSNKEMNLFIKMGAICDVYDAITSDRPYKKGWTPQEALRKMADWQGHFDQKVFQAFVKTIGIYPVGTMVLLDNEKVAIVVDQTHSLLRPKVKVFYNKRINERSVPEIIDLNSAKSKEKIVSIFPAESLPFVNIDELLDL